MGKLDERLRSELERLSPPADPTDVVDRVLRRGARRYAVRRVGVVALAIVVVAGSAAGVFGLSRVFGERGRRPPVVASQGPDGTATAPTNGDIVFTASSPQGHDLLRVAPDGTDLRRLTPEGAGSYTSPDVSPDGRTVLVVYQTVGSALGASVLATVPIGGGPPTVLSPQQWVVSDPAWSPDGGRIAFVGSPGGPYGIYVLDVASGNAELVPGTDAMSVAQPTWSPDGSRVAFQGSTDSDTHPNQDWDIYSAGLDGSGLTNLTRTPNSSEVMPSWSWALDRIAYIGVGPAEGALLTMTATGADPSTAYSGDLAPALPAWSPDGSAIAFEGGSEGLFTVRPDGTELTPLGVGLGREPAWQPMPTGEQASPTPTASPMPTISPSSAPELRLGFPTCNVSSVSGTFEPGVIGTAWVATKTGDVGCPQPQDADNVVAVDVDGDGQPDASYGPFGCAGTPCAALAAPDLDGDGIDELAVAVGSTGGSIEYQLFSISGAAVTRLHFDCSNCNEGTFVWGRPGGYAEGAYCLPATSAGDFVTWIAERTDAGDRYSVVETTLDVKSEFLSEVDRRDSFVPYDLASLPPGGADDFCGAPVNLPT